MASGTRRTTTTKKGVLEKVRKDLDRLSSLQSNLIRMRYGISERTTAQVGEPQTGCSTEAVRRIRAIEKSILDRARGEDPDPSVGKVKDKIVKTMKKKT
jgi:DNA-directed RNA polymerase sigma subunit (sigma70/sigma32)